MCDPYEAASVHSPLHPCTYTPYTRHSARGACFYASKCGVEYAAKGYTTPSSGS